MDGSTWTRKQKIVDAIDSSQDKGSGMVALNTWDPEEFEELCTELVGICAEQKRLDDRVYEFAGWDDDSPRWSIQLCLCPHTFGGKGQC